MEAISKEIEENYRSPSYVIQSGKAKKMYKKYGWGKLLDLGCGGCDFLHQVGGSGLDMANFSRYPDVNVRIADLSKPFPQGVEADTMTAWNMVEHLRNPYNFIDEVYRILPQSGIFIFSIPNNFSLINRLTFLFSGEMTRYSKHNDHLVIFTKHTLKEYCKKFHVVREGYLGHDIGFLKYIPFSKSFLKGRLFSHTQYFVLKKQ